MHSFAALNSARIVTDFPDMLNWHSICDLAHHTNITVSVSFYNSLLTPHITEKLYQILPKFGEKW